MRMCCNVFCYRSAAGRLLNIIVFMTNAQQARKVLCCGCQFSGYWPFGISNDNIPDHPACKWKRDIDFLYIEFTEVMSSPIVWNMISVSYITRSINVPILENHESTSDTCRVVLPSCGLFIENNINQFLSISIFHLNHFHLDECSTKCVRLLCMLTL